MQLNIVTIPANTDPSPGVVVLLHGWGGNVQNLAEIAQYLRLPQFQFYLPSAPFPHPYNPDGSMWYGFPDQYSFDQNDPFRPGEDRATSHHLLTEWLQILPEKTGIPLSRTILGGFSQGGAMTLDVGLSLPLAGLMVMSGFLHAPPTIDHPPSMPILMVHGRQDAVVPLATAHRARATLQQLDANLDYQELDMGHEIDLDALQFMRQFIKARLMDI
jgi:phospholipase/carboxylesterase